MTQTSPSGQPIDERSLRPRRSPARPHGRRRHQHAGGRSCARSRRCGDRREERTNGTITAGNAPGRNDDAAVVLADETWARERGLAAKARLVSYGIAAVEPGMFGLGPIPAVRQALQRAGWDIRSIERVEINEAFAAIAIVVARELGLPEDIVNVDGGAIAHGHPIGATGAVLTTKLIHSMRRDGLTGYWSRAESKNLRPRTGYAYLRLS
jgi:acetyl-CoA acetyltransferase